MKNLRSLIIFGLALACAAIFFGLAVCAQAQTVTFLTQAGATSVIQGTDGNLYGTAVGGLHDQGQVFRMTPAGELATIYSFCSQPNCPDGADPFSAPILESDGNPYGVMAPVGNANRAATIYRLTHTGQIDKVQT